MDAVIWCGRAAFWDSTKNRLKYPQMSILP